MGVNIRKKTVQGGEMQSLYLDIYQDGMRERKALGLSIYTNPKTPLQKIHNKEILREANTIRAKQDLILQQGGSVHKSIKNKKNDFLDYFYYEVQHRKNTGTNYESWLSVFRHLEGYVKETMKRPRIDEVDIMWLENFKAYLLKHVSQNSAHTYFNKVKARLYQAERDKIIIDNPAYRVASPKQVDTVREYLTKEELQKLVHADFKYPEMKKAFFFSAFTGLRWSDIEKMKWSEIRHDDESGWHIVYKQQKTRETETLPIAKIVRDLLGKAGQPNELVFKNLTYSARHNIDLQDWITKAGIKKHITFHCARHTYATSLITNGTDILSVSKMLGHRNLKTTEIYTKVIDKLKVEAANNIHTIDFNE